MARQSPNGRPLVGRRLNDTSAIVNRGLPPPQGRFELHWPPSAEAMVTPIDQGGCKPDFEGVENASPDRGNSIARVADYLGPRHRP